MNTTMANPSWNYLRVRGEYPHQQQPGQYKRELPPRARRILGNPHAGVAVLGTTSACAENTSGLVVWSRSCWNYLRVRGEYATSTSRKSARAELPPRARRILECPEDYTDAEGTTSACAENTVMQMMARMWIRNYLRVRGEYFFCT